MKRKIQYMPLAAIVSAERNPKRHDAAGIRRSMQRFGYMEALLLDERTGRLVAGHGRCDELRAMHADGAAPPADVRVRRGEWLVPVQRGWSSRDDVEADAIGVALNRLTERGGWDYSLLTQMLQEFEQGTGQEGMDGLNGLGFDAADLDDMRALAEERSEASARESTSEARFMRSAVRSLVLDFPLEDFEYVATSCARLRQHLECETNAELVGHLVRERAAQLPSEP